jgi:hypothetical protein
MARTLSEVKQSLYDRKEANSDLDVLDSTSQVAIWKLILDVTAFGIWAFEALLDLSLAELDDKKSELVTGVDRYYQETALDFQLGDELVWDGISYKYDVIDETKQIVKYASAITAGSQLRIKVAKDDGTGLPEKLDTSELTSFRSYMDSLTFSGTVTAISSNDADEAHIKYNIIYDPLVLNDDGSLISDITTFPVEDAINNYLITLDFSGIFRVAELTDAIQLAEGVTNVVATTVDLRPFGGAYTDILANTKQEYISAAGYIVIDSTYPLLSNLTYLAK